MSSGQPKTCASFLRRCLAEPVEILSDEKLSFYRLEGMDIAFAEEIDLKSAELYGMTRQEYMQNRKLQKEGFERCRLQAGDEALKCIADTSKKYGLHDSQKIPSR